MNQRERLDSLLEALKADSSDYKSLSVENNETAKKIAIRSLMNVRMPRTISDKLLRLQDEYLQEECEKKGIVSLDEIKTVAEEFDSTHLFSDKLSIWQGDITRLKVGAIVNAANSQMLGCFIPCHRCIDNAIHSAAGLQLREECSHIMNQKRILFGTQYEEPTGTATVTAAYNLPCDAVLHTVGPIVGAYLTDSLREDLRNCYKNVLNACLEHGIRSVAFCCISTGEFHFPNDEAAKIAVQTVTEFLEKHSDGIDRVIFNVFKELDKDLYIELLTDKI